MKVKESLRKNDFFHKIFSSHQKRKNIKKFIQILQKRANTQIQDRICYQYIPSIKGYTFTVLDGHGSKQCAEFAYKKINHFIRKRFEQNKQLKLSLKKLVQKSLTQAFEDVQNQWHKVYEKHFGENKFKRSGACCLTALVLQNTIHIANAGDCQGALLGQHQPIKTNRRLNADQPQQMKRLKREFPHENNLIVQRQNDQKTSCYVKGLLQPTRALGDFQLKEQKSSKMVMGSFNGPYIDYRPIFSHFKFKPESKFLVLATDGMWDQIDLETVDHIVRTSKEKISNQLFAACMDSITKRNKMTEKQLDQFSYKRPFHDDISIIVVDLQKMKQTLTTA